MIFSDVIKCRPSNYRNTAHGDGLSAGGSFGGQRKALPSGLQENRREDCVAHNGIGGVSLKRSGGQYLEGHFISRTITAMMEDFKEDNGSM